jgi:hypothetical protein
VAGAKNPENRFMEGGGEKQGALDLLESACLEFLMYFYNQNDLITHNM